MTSRRTAIVTGSTSGIGLGIAKVLAKSGMNVMLNGLGKPDDIRSAVASVRAAGRRVRVRHHPADMTKPDDIRQLVAETAAVFGALDVLVNNAGVQFTAPVETFPAAEWDNIIAINLSAAFHATQAAIPLMRDNHFGRIINIASVHGLVASVEKAAYVAAKFGIVGLTKVVALENAVHGITCNAICPGWVRTPLVERQIEALAERESLSLEAATEKLLSAKQPSRRFTDVSELGALVQFLCTPVAHNITGATLTVDGGWTAQ